MTNWSIDTKITAGFAAALATVAVIDAFSYRSITALVDTVHRVTHTHHVLDALDDVLALLKNAETGQRGYLLTGEEQYLQPFATAIENIDQELASLRRQTAGSSTQAQRIAELDALIAEKFAELTETIELRRSQGFDAAVEVVRTDRGKVIMDRIRQTIEGMHDEELTLLLQQEAQTGGQIRFTFYIIGVGSLLGLLLVGVAIYVIRLDIAQRERAERALQTAYDELEVRIRDRTAELERTNGELETEIADRQAAQRRLQEMFSEIAKNRDDMQSILNRLQLGTAIIDAEGRVEFVSEAAQRLFGRGHEDILGTRWDEAFPFNEADKARLRSAIASTSAPGSRIPAHFESAAGQQYWVNIDVQDDPRDPKRKVVFFYDVSEVYDLRRQLDEKARFQRLVGKSAAMQRVYQLIDHVSKVDSTVLIEGETGTGKELVAGAIHESSRRRDKPFIAVNSAGLTDSLLASQLFGHRRGAFTGAVADQAGFFEAAHGGTLFLDEVGDISPSVETALLRVLQEKEIVRLGESRPRRVDVRVLAATQRDLGKAVEKGAFRADLFYRIRVARIYLPPLRERREDIPLLVEFFLAEGRAVVGKDTQHVSTDAMRLLLEHDWPGNVRELKSAIEFALIHSAGPVIRAEDLPPEILEGTERDLPLGDPESERERLLAALKAADGNRSAAARLLGVSRSTFYRRLSALAIEA